MVFWEILLRFPGSFFRGMFAWVFVYVVREFDSSGLIRCAYLLASGPLESPHPLELQELPKCWTWTLVWQFFGRCHFGKLHSFFKELLHDLPLSLLRPFCETRHSYRARVSFLGSSITKPRKTWFCFFSKYSWRTAYEILTFIDANHEWRFKSALPILGPDGARIFIGSEGTLGVITSAWMRVQERPKYRTSTVVRFKNFLDGAEAVRRIGQSGATPSNCRLIDALEVRRNARLLVFIGVYFEVVMLVFGSFQN